MMSEIEVAAALLSLSVMAAIWALLFYGFGRFRVDLTRQRLFQLRHELFAYAAAGNIEFDNPAYGILRLTINGFIRFADRTGLLTIGLAHLVFQTEDGRLLENHLHERWHDANRGLPFPVKRRMLEFRNRMHMILIEHLLITPLGIVLVAPIITLFAVRLLRGRVGRSVRRLFEPALTHADSAALIEAEGIRHAA
jgi:hypothetical protein